MYGMALTAVPGRTRCLAGLLKAVMEKVMSTPSERNPGPVYPYNRRRVVMLIVIVFVVVLSFFAGKHYGSKTYMQPVNSPNTGQPGADRASIPPDSLAH